jgi:hypothetical protein
MSLPHNKNISLSLSRYQWWRLSAILMFGLMFSAFFATSYFLYNFIFSKLEDAHTIILLNSEAPTDTINMDNYQKARAYIDLKNSSLPLVFPIRNIFSFAEKTNKPRPTTVTTTKK